MINMRLIRRLWLLPAAIVTFICYYLLFGSSGTTKLRYPSTSDDGKLHWVKLKERYPVSKYLSPPRGAAHRIPRIQHSFEHEKESAEVKRRRETRRDAVKEAFVHAWNGYKEHAWSKDEVAPISGGWLTSFSGWGATLVDTMDTLWIMGLKEDFEQCVEEVKNIDFTTSEDDIINVFETTIRYLGGLISAYELSDRKYKVLINKAKELADILYTAFDTPNRMPMTRWTWRKSAEGGRVEASETTLIAELGSLILEFTKLTQLTGNLKYFDAVQRINFELQKVQHNSSLPGMWPVVINARTMEMPSNHFTLSGMADSTFEYLPKQHLLLGGRIETYGRMYEKAMETAQRYIFYRPLTENNEDILLSGNAFPNEDEEPLLEPEGQHLACYTGGMLAIGAMIFERPGDLDIARRLVEGCVWAYKAMPSGLMPEVFHTVSCQKGIGKPNLDACQWSKEKWYKGIVDKQKDNEETDKMTTDEKAEYWIKKKNLFPGFTDIKDGRYILR
jgi:mannosyl-oligosaccharide alpha-1,2-mannosidase